MKIHILFFILFLNSFTVTQAHQNDFAEHCDAISLPYLGSSHRWNAVASTDSALYLVGNSGVCFIYTYKGGVKTIYTGTTANLTGVQFINSTIGFVWGTNGTLFKTIDSGNNWSAIATNTTDTINKVQFIDATNGYMMIDAVISKTNNGGALWTPLTLPATITFKDFHFFDSQNGQLCGQKTTPSLSGYLFETTDGGSSWNQIYSDTCAFTKLFYTSSNKGYLYGKTSNNPLLLETTNIGANWALKYSSSLWKLQSDVVMFKNQTTFVSNEAGINYMYGTPYFLDVNTGPVFNPINVYSTHINNQETLYLITEAGLYRYVSGELLCRQVNFSNGVSANTANPYNILAPGKIVRLKALLNNIAINTIANAKGTVKCSSPYITIIDSVATYNNIISHQFSWALDEYEIQLSTDIPNNYVIHLEFLFENNTLAEPIQRSIFDLPIVYSAFGLSSVAVFDTATENTLGNGNGIIEPLETAQLKTFVKNESVHYFYNMRGYLISPFSQCAIWTNNALPDGSGVVYNNYAYGNISPNQIEQPTGPYVFTDSFQTIYKIPFILKLVGQISTYKDENNYSYPNYLNVLYNFQIDFTINNSYSLPPDSALTIAPSVPSPIFPVDSTIIGIGLTNRSSSFKLFPNPNNGEFYLITNLKATENTVAEIHNILGERIYNQTIQEEPRIEINISNQPQGLYFLTIKNTYSTETIKFIKE